MGGSWAAHTHRQQLHFFIIVVVVVVNVAAWLVGSVGS